MNQYSKARSSLKFEADTNEARSRSSDYKITRFQNTIFMSLMNEEQFSEEEAEY